jgi:C4-dicarboxylate-specific signal transduction histidine kinase
MQLNVDRMWNRMSRPRYRHNEEAAAGFERVLTHVSATFAGARWHSVPQEVDVALHEVLRFCAIDHAAIFEVRRGDGGAYLRHFACVSGTPAPDERFSYTAAFPWAYDRSVQRGEVVAIARAEDLPPAARADAASITALGLRSLLHLPLRVGGEVRYVLTAGAKRRVARWSARRISRLTALGEILAHAIARATTVAGAVDADLDAHDMLGEVHVGRWEWDIAADTVHFTEEAERIFGASIAGLPQLLRLVHDEDRAELERNIAAARDRPGTRFKTFYVIHAQDRDPKRICQWHEVLFPGTRTARLVATVQDVTAQTKAEQEISELRAYHWHSARVAQTAPLVASLAHELCQPLSAMLNNAQAGLRFLKNQNLDPEEMRDILSDIVASNKRANEVLGALRAMLRRRHTTRTTFEIAEAVHDVLALVRSELMSEQIDVDTVLAPDAWVHADKTQIEQVLLNLVMNAIDAMRGLSEGVRRLQISVSHNDAGDSVIFVKDTGRGIPADKLPRVFEAFWTTKNKGLGVGLSLCRAIVESCGGRIWCEPNLPRGAIFRLTLPASGAQESELTGSPVQAAGRF